VVKEPALEACLSSSDAELSLVSAGVEGLGCAVGDGKGTGLSEGIGEGVGLSEGVGVVEGVGLSKGVGVVEGVGVGLWAETETPVNAIRNADRKANDRKRELTG
jgi:hypothetical protein